MLNVMMRPRDESRRDEEDEHVVKSFSRAYVRDFVLRKDPRNASPIKRISEIDGNKAASSTSHLIIYSSKLVARMAAPLVSPGIAYQNRRVCWDSNSADYLRNEGCELPSSLFENTKYDIIFYAYTNDVDDISISRTAQGHLHFVPSTEISHVNHEFLEDGSQRRTMVTKPADHKSYAATIDMPRGSVGQDLSDKILGRHLELLLNGFNLLVRWILTF